MTNPYRGAMSPAPLAITIGDRTVHGENLHDLAGAVRALGYEVRLDSSDSFTVTGEPGQSFTVTCVAPADVDEVPAPRVGLAVRWVRDVRLAILRAWRAAARVAGLGSH